MIEKLEKEKKQIEQEVKQYMQDNEKAKSDSFEVSWKEITQRRIDTEKLRAEQPKIYNQYLKTYQMRKFGVKDV